MKTIKVLKQTLLEILRKNRSKHQTDYENAVKDYRDKAKADLTKALKNVRPLTDKVDGKDEAIYIHLTLPINYIKDYDRTINMLEMDTLPYVELDQKDYQCYVEDNWEWKTSFTSINSFYADGKSK